MEYTPEEQNRLHVTNALMNSLLQLVSIMDRDLLLKEEQVMSRKISEYEAIGIIDGLKYYEKLRKMRALYTRLCAVNNLIQTFLDTNEKIEEADIEKLKEGLN